MSTTVDMLSLRIDALEKQIALLFKNQKPKKEKKTKDESSDEDKPKKKRVSGYIIFSNANRDDIKTKLSTGDEKPKNTEVMKGLAAMWKELNDEEREEWNSKAKSIKEADA